MSVLLALDAEVLLLGQGEKTESKRLGDFLPVRDNAIAGKLMKEVVLPHEITGAYFYTARSPADLPIVAAAAVKWPSGRTRVVLAGFGDQPRMVFDGPDPDGAVIAARDAYSEAGDQWASAEYRSDTAAALVTRCLTEINEMDQG